MKYTVCPNCGHDWTAHSAYIARGERMCEEQLPNGYSLHIHYTDQNMLMYAQAYERDTFVCQHVGNRAIARCKQSITRRARADDDDLRLQRSLENREKPWFPIQPGQEDW